MEEMRSIQAKLPYDAMLAFPFLRRKGGLAMLWTKAEVDLHIQTYTQNHIDALILTNPMKPWRITGFYGRLEEHLRHETWGLLRHLQTRHSYPWVCIRDYNEILVSEEKQGRLLKAQNFM